MEIHMAEALDSSLRDKRRNRLSMYNVLSTVGYQIVVIVCGLILPRAILNKFGSEVNGVVSSVTQFITCVELLRSGIGGVTRAALYKPLADGNTERVSSIMRATERFMRKLAVIYSVLLVIFAALYPLLVSESFGWFFTFTLVLIIGLRTVFDCCFGVSCQFLLQADQHRYIQSAVYAATTILNTVIALILLKFDCSVHQVKFFSALIFSLNPIVLYIYVRKRYGLDKKAEPDSETIKGRWDAFAHQVSNFITVNSDVSVLTVMSDLVTVSVYSVYNQVVSPMRNLVTAVANGLEGAIGDVIWQESDSKVRSDTKRFNYLMLQVSSLMWTCTAVLITPFVAVYTSDVTDASYIYPVFGYMMVAAQFMICLRTPYQTLVNASGHFKETRNAAIVEAILNIGFTVLSVMKFGLIGVTFGTVIAVGYRTLHYVWYVNKHIVGGVWRDFVKNLAFAACLFASVYAVSLFLPQVWGDGFIGWIGQAFIVFFICICFMCIYNFIFFPRIFRAVASKLLRIFRRK